MATDLERFTEAHLAELRDTNAARERALIAQGVKINDEGLLRLQVETLKDLILDGDPDAQLEYAVRYQEQVTKAFDAVQADLNRKRLTDPPANGKLLRMRPGG